MKKSLLLTIACFLTLLSKAQISTASQWTWMKGDNSPKATGIYGTKGTPADANTPGARQGSVSWKDASGNLWLFGGSGYVESGYGYLNDLWKYNASTNQWTWIKGDNTLSSVGVYGTQGVEAAANQPGARASAISWTDASGNFWLFGGSGYAASGSGYLNDLWKYNPATNAWTWVKGDNAVNIGSSYQTQGLPAATNKPGARFSGAAWTDAVGNVWLFGGRGYISTDSPGGSTNLNDLWRYNPSANLWTLVNDNAAGVYGTQGIPSAANRPEGRYSSSSWKDANGNLWLFGGETYSSLSVSFNSFNDLWRYNPTTNQWAWMKGDNTRNSSGVYGVQGMADAANKPGARHAGTSWTDAAGNFWLFGGQIFYGFNAMFVQDEYNDLWKYDPLQNQWTWMKGDVTRNSYGVYGTQASAAATNKPGARAIHTSWMDNVGNIWLFGGFGYTAGTSGLLNDLWKLGASTNGALPVTLLTLSATPKNRTVDVAWKTAQEINTGHFVLERSADGRMFSSIDSVAATGNSSSVRGYSFTDKQPFAGDNFYRIKTMDKDGSFTYSAVVKAALSSMQDIVVYPNPVITTTTISLRSARALVVRISVYDGGGKLSRQLQKNVAAGAGSFALDMRNLPKGIYTAVIAWEQESRTVRMVKE